MNFERGRLMQLKVISLLVSNKSGVLNRISGLIGRRGYNIENITVGVTSNPELSRMTIVVDTDDDRLEQVIKQLDKLIDVKKIKYLPEEAGTFRELALVKVHSNNGERMQVMNIVNKYGGIILDMGNDTITVQLTGSAGMIENAIEDLKPYKIFEIARTGLTALERGDKNL
jgi:acetolactate synthase-1/3 small subunit